MRPFKNTSLLLSLILSISSLLPAQTQPPAPGPAKAVSIPTVASKTLANGLTVGVVRKTGSPLVTVRLVVKSGAGHDVSRLQIAFEQQPDRCPRAATFLSFQGIFGRD